MNVIILGGETAGDALARALAGEGREAIRYGDDRLPDLVPDARAANVGALAPGAVVIIVGAIGADRATGSLADMSDDDWTAAFERPLRQARVRLQAAGKLLADGGRVIVVAGTGGMAGVAGDVAGGAVEEGVRALAKSVALAWQPRGITLVFAAFAADALASERAIRDVVAPTVGMLLAAVPALSGSTVIADGGILLAP